MVKQNVFHHEIAQLPKSGDRVFGTLRDGRAQPLGGQFGGVDRWRRLPGHVQCLFPWCDEASVALQALNIPAIGCHEVNSLHITLTLIINVKYAHLMYASECKTRCGRGGTVTNSGSAGGAETTAIKD